MKWASAMLKQRFPTKATCLTIYSRVVNAQGDLSERSANGSRGSPAHEDALRALFASYVEMKQRQNVLDYDDLLLYFAQMLAEPAIAAEIAARFDHLLVDEYQDTNALQGEIVLRLRPQGRGLTVVGDDAQAIYSFRAATVRNILDFPARLRSAGACGDARAQLPFERRRPCRRQRGHCARARALRQNLRTDRPHGPLPVLVDSGDDADQARFVATRVLANREAGASLKAQAVLFRASHHSAALELELTRRNMPFVKYGGLKFLDAAHVKDARRAHALRRKSARSRRGLSRRPAHARRRAEGRRDHRRRGGGRRRLRDDGGAVDAGESAGRLSRLRRPHAQACVARRAVAGGDRRRCRVARPAHGDRYDDARVRMGDLEALERIAASFPSRERFLSELALDPPDATSDEAGPPLQG